MAALFVYVNPQCTAALPCKELRSDRYQSLTVRLGGEGWLTLDLIQHVAQHTQPFAACVLKRQQQVVDHTELIRCDDDKWKFQDFCEVCIRVAW